SVTADSRPRGGDHRRQATHPLTQPALASPKTSPIARAYRNRACPQGAARGHSYQSRGAQTEQPSDHVHGATFTTAFVLTPDCPRPPGVAQGGGPRVVDVARGCGSRTP